jgi:hypothetical protein
LYFVEEAMIFIVALFPISKAFLILFFNFPLFLPPLSFTFPQFIFSILLTISTALHAFSIPPLAFFQTPIWPFLSLLLTEQSKLTFFLALQSAQLSVELYPNQHFQNRLKSTDLHNSHIQDCLYLK